MYLENARMYFGMWLAEDWPKPARIVGSRFSRKAIRRLALLKNRDGEFFELEAAPPERVEATPRLTS
jgi:hypothetical protein